MKSGEKIVITGGLGYIGMELSKIYSGKSRYLDITVIDNKFYSNRVSQLKRWGINFEHIDILDFEKLEKHISKADLIYHLAGITDVPRTKSAATREKDERIKLVGEEGTQNILNNISQKCKIIFPSTHVVYEGIKDVRTDISEDEEIINTRISLNKYIRISFFEIQIL